jgi:hypothetical protein
MEVRKKAVTVRLSSNFILGAKIYTFNREGRVSGETSVTVCIAVRGIQRGRMIQRQRKSVIDRGRRPVSRVR